MKLQWRNSRAAQRDMLTGRAQKDIDQLYVSASSTCLFAEFDQTAVEGFGDHKRDDTDPRVVALRQACRAS